jgi:hypothetical protein
VFGLPYRFKKREGPARGALFSQKNRSREEMGDARPQVLSLLRDRRRLESQPLVGSRSTSKQPDERAGECVLIELPLERRCAIGPTLPGRDRACPTPERLGVLAQVDSSGRLSNALGADTAICGISVPAHLQNFLLPPHRYRRKLRPIGLP